ncbi:MAG: molecular chaperone GrpE [Pseudohongiellaceae bacterium]
MSNESKDSPINEEVENNAAEQPQEVVTGELVDDVEAELSAASEEVDEQIEALKADVLRAHAETQNARRRAEQDVEKARKFALEKFVGELLPVADNLERAIASGNSEDEGQKVVLEGVALTHKSLLDTLKKFKVEAIDPHGEPFDPQLHQAMSMVPNPDAEPNTVLTVFQKGYTLNGRLVRPAMVVVSSAVAGGS